MHNWEYDKFLKLWDHVVWSHQDLKRDAVSVLLQEMHLLYNFDERCLFTAGDKKTD